MLDVGNWRIWIAGSPQRAGEAEYLSSLRTFASTADLDDRVRFIGERSDVSAVLQSADIYCQPNLGPETFGIVFIEALYAGLPVVTTKIGAAPEIVNDDCGRLVSQSEQLADVLKNLIEDALLRRHLGWAGPKRAAELCDPAVTMPIIERAFQSVIERTKIS
jgi:glycosyltransferase involved in cell wall biosynthesis